MAKMPTFLVVGAARSGTTALYTYLQQHPQIFMSPLKETNFFSFEDEQLDYRGPGEDYVNKSITRLSEYQALFAEAPEGHAIGEASPLYLYTEKAPERIHRHLPDVKLIAILRDPIEQAFSHFLYAKRQTLEPLDDFYAALQAEGERARDRWQPLFQYSQFPKYGLQLERYYERFPAEQLKVFLYEDFSDDPESVLAEIYSFIGVDPEFVADLTYRPNAGGVPRSSWLQKFVMEPHLLNRIVGSVLPEELKRRIRDAISDRNVQRPELPAAAREQLRAELHPDILELQKLIGRDLSAWLE
jgi:hypothetical protein